MKAIEHILFMKINFYNFLSTIFRFVLGGLFIYAALRKLVDINSLAVTIEIYEILPEALVMPVAWAIPLIELIAGFGLILNLKGSLATHGLMLAMFSGVLGYGIYMGLDIDCGCFGPVDPDLGSFGALKQSLIRNITLLSSVLYIYLWRFFTNHQPKDLNQLKQSYNRGLQWIRMEYKKTKIKSVLDSY